MSSFRAVWRIIDRSERRTTAEIVFLTLIGTLFETLGVGLVFPASALLLGDPSALRLPIVHSVLPAMEHASKASFAVAGFAVLLVFYILRTGILAFVVWRQTKFAFDVQANLSNRLFDRYLNQPYVFHLRTNSAQLLRNLTAEVSQFTFSIMLPGMLLVTETLVLLGIIGLVIWAEPLGAMILVTTIGLFSVGFYRGTRKSIGQWGLARQLHEGKRLQVLQQGLGGVKEVLLLRRSADFLREYQEHNQASARVGRQSTTLQRMPLLLLELLAMSGVAVLVVVLLRDGRSPESIVPVLGLFAAAAFRLLPSVNRLLGAVQGLKFGQPVLELLSRELGLPAQRASSLRIGARLNGDIRFSDVSYLYEGAQSLSIQGVNFSIRRGECVGVVGPSGAGKSTLVDLFLGLLVPTKGSILVGGVPITDALDSWQGGIGYVPQAVFLIDDTLRRNVAFGVPPADVDESRVLGAIEAAQLAPFVASLPLGLDTIVGERGARLSGGQAQRIGIARALYSDPSILVFDEATSSLDADTEAGVMTAIESLRRERTIVIVAHRTATVRRCDFIIRIEGGRVAAMGRPSDVLRADSGVPTTDGSAFSSV